MVLNEFSMRIVEGIERSGGYVELEHDTQYAISLRSYRDVPCQVQVRVDGKEVGLFKIERNGHLQLDRSVDDQGRFTFYRTGTPEFEQSQLSQVSSSDLGLVQAIFTPEKYPIVVEHHQYYHHYDWEPKKLWPANASYTVLDAGTPVTMLGVTSHGGSGTTTWTNVTPTASYNNSGRAAGGTGLSGHSHQEFVPGHIGALDYSQQTQISLRLIAKNSVSEGPRPLLSVANPIPPPAK